MLEKMAEFFEKRLDSYDEHMMSAIEGAKEFYPFTAKLLPRFEGTSVLDLGCGTGLELEHYLPLCPTARITGIDLSKKMLAELEKKFAGFDLNLICDSYFDTEFGTKAFDAAISVESLHHFTKEEKIPLYRKIQAALKDGGYFILTDYFAASDEEEDSFRKELLAQKTALEIADSEFYHFDTPLTVDHETEALKEAGFSQVEILQNWAATYTIKAKV